MTPGPSATARRLGVATGDGIALLCALYAAVLAAGLVTLPSADQPIGPPWFTIMEFLIVVLAPTMVLWTVALHAWVPADRKALALASVSFMGLCAAITCGVHFAILTLSHRPEFAGPEWSRLVFAFRWPSLAYALDILAWDVFFALAAACAAAAIPANGPARVVRLLLVASAALAFAGLAGVALADMRVRNLGILGYVVLFPVATGLMSRLLRRQARLSA